MSFLNRFFKKKSTTFERADIYFGRYNESLRRSEQNHHWDRAQDEFSNGEFLASVTSVLNFLSDPGHRNLRFQRSARTIDFSFAQGSIVITGRANPLKIHAEAKICQYTNENEDLFHSLLIANYNLTYSKYVLQGRDIVLKFNSSALDASPFKIAQGLRELALAADKQDDLVLDKYSDDLTAKAGWVNALKLDELEIKRAFLQKKMAILQENYQHLALDPQEYTGAFAYLILDTCYCLDYLLKPEGQLMDLFEKVHQGYFGPKGVMNAELNDNFFGEVVALCQDRAKVLEKECYNVNYTFGYTAPVTTGRVQAFILEEVEKMDWYINNGHREVALAIPGYIIGYSLFHYDVPQPFPALFGLYYEILEADFYAELGFFPKLMNEGILNRGLIEERLSLLIQGGKRRTKGEPAWKGSIRYDSIYHFSKSYLQMIGQLDTSL